MDKIELQKIEEYSDTFSSYYFLDAGDIRITPTYWWSGITIERQNGLPLFEMEMNPSYVIALGEVFGRPLNQESFKLPAGMESDNILKKDVICLDPRVVAYVIFMDLLSVKVFKNGKKVKDIELPVLSMEEAKDFLRKNNLLRKNLPFEFESPLNPPKKLIGIPEKVQALFE